MRPVMGVSYPANSIVAGAATPTALLQRQGYSRTDTVIDTGEFAVRGSIIDLYPMGSATPYRIDLFDDEVESIRVFDPETQRSGERGWLAAIPP